MLPKQRRKSAPRESSKKNIVLELLRRPDRRNHGRDRQRDQLAEPQHPGLHQRKPHEEDGPDGRVHQKRHRRADLQGRDVDRTRILEAAALRVAAFFIRTPGLFTCLPSRSE